MKEEDGKEKMKEGRPWVTWGPTVWALEATETGMSLKQQVHTTLGGSARRAGQPRK